MSLNGSGVFNVNSAGQPVVAGTLITAAAFNAYTADVAAALSTALYSDGQRVNAANQNMGGYKLTGLAAGSSAGDSVRYEQLPEGRNLTGGLNGKLTTVASANYPDVFATTVGNMIDYTGTVMCFGFAAAPQAGAERVLICAGAATFAPTVDFILDGFPAGTVYTAKPGDKVIVRAVTTTQFRATVQPVAGAVTYLLFQEQAASGTAGGTFTSGAWRTRGLNTETVDDFGFGTLGAGQVTLQPGTYRFRGIAAGYYVNRHQTRLQNITAGTTIASGMTAYSPAVAGASQTVSEVAGRFAIGSAAVFELQHRAETTEAMNGLGIAASFGTEVYSQLEFWRES